jgi:hypothetical protein
MTSKRILIPVFAAFLAVTSPSAFADKGKGGGHGRGHGRGARFDDRDDDRGVRRLRVREGTVRRQRILRVRSDGRRFVRPSQMRFHGLDGNGDGRVTRREWRGNDQSFRVHDLNRDGVLSGREVWTGSLRYRRR